ncbi:methyltransferase domain-containing protein [Halomonas sp. WWR20]
MAEDVESSVPPPCVAASEHDEWQRRVAHAFGRAAPHYVSRAHAQHTMGEALWRRLPASASRIVDLGCGPGHWSARLAGHYRQADPSAAARTLGLDIAPGMLAEARRRHGDSCDWLCADAEALPLRDASVDLVFSNLAIQWCRHPARLMAELWRVMAPRATALINTLEPGSLHEVRHAWGHDGGTTSAFASAASLERAVHHAGFEGVVLERVVECYHYPHLRAVTASIKGIGAQLARPGAHLTRGDIARAAQRYEALRTAQGLPVTYRRLTLELRK